LLLEPATPGFENVPSIVLQAHMDMVCSAHENVDFNFLTDPIECKVEGNLLKASGTTLGADNGIGVGTMLAILSDKFDHGPIECLFTYDEETTMSGAEFLDPFPYLQSKAMINLDSEEENSICLGCAGGFETKIFINLSKEVINVNEFNLYEVYLGGLQGGHTGVDINKGRGNAIKLITRTISAAIELDIHLVSFIGGSAVNTIPRECNAEVYVHKDKSDQFIQLLNKEFEIIKYEFQQIEPGIVLSIDQSNEKKRNSL